MRETVRRFDVRSARPELLAGEDEDFTRHIRQLTETENS
jgi:hypothetical protein